MYLKTMVESMMQLHNSLAILVSTKSSLFQTRLQSFGLLINATNSSLFLLQKNSTSFLYGLFSESYLLDLHLYLSKTGSLMEAV